MEISVEIEGGEEKKEDKEPKEWEIKQACQTVLEAEEIKANEKLWPLVKDALKNKGVALKKAIGSLDELKAVAYKKTKA